jgi:hypothetical protein
MQVCLFMRDVWFTAVLLNIRAAYHTMLRGIESYVFPDFFKVPIA